MLLIRCSREGPKQEVWIHYGGSWSNRSAEWMVWEELHRVQNRLLTTDIVRLNPAPGPQPVLLWYIPASSYLFLPSHSPFKVHLCGSECQNTDGRSLLGYNMGCNQAMHSSPTYIFLVNCEL